MDQKAQRLELLYSFHVGDSTITVDATLCSQNGVLFEEDIEVRNLRRQLMILPQATITM